MSKTQKKMELVATEESPSFKRKRMKEVRAMISKALAKNQRIDLMNWEGTDIARVMVALQDEVMRSRERHQRATQHIATGKFIMEQNFNIMRLQANTMNALVHDLDSQGQIIHDLSTERNQLLNRKEDLEATVRVMVDG